MTDRIDPYYIAQLEQIAKMIGWPRLIKEAQARHDAEESMKPPEKYVPGTPFFDLRGEFAKRKVSLPDGFITEQYKSFRKDESEGLNLPPLSIFPTRDPKKTVIRSRIVRGKEAIKLAEEKGLQLRCFQDKEEEVAEEISIEAAKILMDKYHCPDYNDYLKRVYVVERTTENFKQESE